MHRREDEIAQASVIMKWVQRNDYNLNKDSLKIELKLYE